MPNNRHRAVARAKRNRINAELAKMSDIEKAVKFINEFMDVFKIVFEKVLDIVNTMEEGE